MNKIKSLAIELSKSDFKSQHPQKALTWLLQNEMIIINAFADLQEDRRLNSYKKQDLTLKS